MNPQPEHFYGVTFLSPQSAACHCSDLLFRSPLKFQSQRVRGGGEGGGFVYKYSLGGGRASGLSSVTPALLCVSVLLDLQFPSTCM